MLRIISTKFRVTKYDSHEFSFAFQLEVICWILNGKIYALFMFSSFNSSIFFFHSILYVYVSLLYSYVTTLTLYDSHEHHSGTIVYVLMEWRFVMFLLVTNENNFRHDVKYFTHASFEKDLVDLFFVYHKCHK